ncbi:hypothetical protein [Clostridium sp.]|uniref:hypothetical protein n=1 Tax=Clostridium sp. TaxID=1506 RepID=UPI00260E8CE1|nr:hypothetical protein [Clostridium sp.]
MTNDSVDILQKVMSKSPYFEYLYRNITMIGFNLDKNTSDILFTREGNNLSIKKIGKESDINPELWVGIDANELDEFQKNNIQLTKLKIYTSSRGTVLNPKVETIIQRIFMPPKDKKYPLEDIIELVYGGMLGFQEPRVLGEVRKRDYMY